MAERKPAKSVEQKSEVKNEEITSPEEDLIAEQMAEAKKKIGLSKPIEKPAIIKTAGRMEQIKHEILKRLPKNFDMDFDYENEFVTFSGMKRNVNRLGQVIETPYTKGLTLKGVNWVDISGLMLRAGIL